mgnify:CR=1 FL=1
MAQKKSFNNLGGRIALTGGLQLRHFDSSNDIVYGPGIYYGTTFPKSGTAGTTVFDGIGARPGSFCDPVGARPDQLPHRGLRTARPDHPLWRARGQGPTSRRSGHEPSRDDHKWLGG